MFSSEFYDISKNNFIKKETLAQVFSCEFYDISKNTFFTEHLWATASILRLNNFKNIQSGDLSQKTCCVTIESSGFCHKCSID